MSNLPCRRKKLDNAQKEVAISNELALKRDVAQDLTTLAKSVLESTRRRLRTTRVEADERYLHGDHWSTR